MRLKVVAVPSIKEPITKSPGFAKKELADYKLDLMALCGFGCSYCSSNEGNYLRINREKFADATEQQTGKRTYPSSDAALTFTWPDVLDKLAKQLANKPKSWGAGKTLVVSMLTDAFSPLPLADGTTRAALEMVLERTSFRIRILTKSATVGTDEWVYFFRAHQDRFVVGLSIGTLDDEWARRVEIGTSSPSARVRALRKLQDADVSTFGMLCPVFPDAMQNLGELVAAIRPEHCETVWAEPYNDRANWRAVQNGYDPWSDTYNWFEYVYHHGKKTMWSDYAATLYRGLIRECGPHASKLRYLLYEGDICAADTPSFAGLRGVLLQSKPGEDGRSTNPAIAALQP